jgi:2-polyprenyl-3-methyl-5-hydroxy-6-metoxy-1,4-benzoquinol methylase
MSFIFPHRAHTLRERMDDLSCDLQTLTNTYQHFDIVNQFLSGWYGIYQHYLRKYLRDGSSLLDIGCGGGDVLRHLAFWTKQDGLSVKFVGIDPDARALEYARSRPHSPNIIYQQASAAELIRLGQTFDIVISNHVLHHLSEDDVYALCKDSEQLAKKLVIHNDLRRSGLAYINFAATRLVFWNSFVIEDGLLSIRRSFTASELQHVAPQNWQIKARIPFRNLLIYEKQ